MENLSVRQRAKEALRRHWIYRKRPTPGLFVEYLNLPFTTNSVRSWLVGNTSPTRKNSRLILDLLEARDITTDTDEEHFKKSSRFKVKKEDNFFEDALPIKLEKPQAQVIKELSENVAYLLAFKERVEVDLYGMSPSIKK